MSKYINIDEENWTHSEIINEIVEALDERCVAIGIETLSDSSTGFYPVSRGDNIQTAEFWNTILEKMKRLIATNNEDSMSMSCISLSDGHEFLYLDIAEFEQLNIGDNLQYFMLNFIRLTKVFIEQTNAVSPTGATGVWGLIHFPLTSTDEAGGCNHSEKVMTSLSIGSPYVAGDIVIGGVPLEGHPNCGAYCDDYFRVDGRSLNSDSIIDDADRDCENGIVGQRWYISRFLGKKGYTLGGISCKIVDTKRGNYGGQIGIYYAPNYKYYPFDTSGLVQA